MFCEEDIGTVRRPMMYKFPSPTFSSKNRDKLIMTFLNREKTNEKTMLEMPNTERKMIIIMKKLQNEEKEKEGRKEGRKECCLRNKERKEQINKERMNERKEKY